MGNELIRFDDWTSRLSRAIDKKRNLPFERGQNDCVMFAIDLIFAMTGTDFGEGIRGKYYDLPSARVFFKEMGYSTPLKALSDYLGQPYSSPYQAKRGDLVLIKSSSPLPVLGICLGFSVVTMQCEKGMAFTGIDQIKKAWKV